MSTNKILLKFAKKGINLSPEAYERVVNAENPLNFASNLIVKLKSDKFSSKDLVSVSGETVDEILGVKPKTESSNQETLAADVKPAVEKEAPKKEPEVDKTPQKDAPKESEKTERPVLLKASKRKATKPKPMSTRKS